MIVFKNKKKQFEFEHNGFAVVELLTRDEAESLKNFYKSFEKEHLLVRNKMHSTCDTANINLIRIVDTEIKKILLPKLENHLLSFEFLLGSFLTKEIGEGSETGFHQDPTLVDEDNYVSANVWVALQDTTNKNGNLLFVKGSHRIFNSLVVTPDFPTFYRNFKDQLHDYACEVPVKMGEAIIFNNKIIHGASPNNSDKERIAAILAIKSKNAKWSLYFKDPGNKDNLIEQYEINTDSFAKLIKNERPTDAKLIRYIKNDFESISYESFLHFMFKNFTFDTVKYEFKRILRKCF